MPDADEQERKRRELAGRNVRLAIGLGLLAIGIYVYFIVTFAGSR